MESEAARLERLYHEMNDEHLLDLATHPEDLTGDARSALARELEDRKLSAPAVPARRSDDDTLHTPTATVDEPELEQGFAPGIPGIFPSSAAVMEQALEPAGEVVDGRARLITFFDGHELTRACETLEAAGIIPEIESVSGDALSGAPPRFDIWIEAGRLERAESLLREKLGLFPIAEEQSADVEHEQDSEPGATAEDGRIVVAELESEADANQAVRLLREKGIEAQLEERTLDNEGVYRVEVNAADQERALAAVAASLGVK